MEQAALLLMKARLSTLFHTASMREKAQLGLCALWLGLVVAFIGFALLAHSGASTTLPRAGFHFPSRTNSHSPNFRTESIVNDLVLRHDQAAARLEQSVRRNARSAFVLNMIAAGLGLFGLGGQWMTARHSPSAAAPQPKPGLAAPQAPTTPSTGPLVSGIHDGSFPDQGYGH